MVKGTTVIVNDGNSLWFGMRGQVLEFNNDKVTVKFNSVIRFFKKTKLNEVKKWK